MPNRSRVLVVDDDPSVCELLQECLGDHQFDVRTAGDGVAMRHEIEQDLPDLVLLDIHLPGEDGIALARFLRERYDLSIIMVTGSGDLVDRVVGLEVGADDYIAKPFDPRELLARVRSVLRRAQVSADRQEAVAPSLTSAQNTEKVRVGRCWLDLVARRLVDAEDEQEVPLTAMEFELLRVFAKNPNRVLSRDQLLMHSRNREWSPDDRSIDIRIGRLRRKIEADPENPQSIRTVRNAGYQFVPP